MKRSSRRNKNFIVLIEKTNDAKEINNFFMNSYWSKIGIFVKLMRKVSVKWKNWLNIRHNREDKVDSISLNSLARYKNKRMKVIVWMTREWGDKVFEGPVAKSSLRDVLLPAHFLVCRCGWDHAFPCHPSLTELSDGVWLDAIWDMRSWFFSFFCGCLWRVLCDPQGSARWTHFRPTCPQKVCIGHRFASTSLSLFAIMLGLEGRPRARMLVVPCTAIFWFSSFVSAVSRSSRSSCAHWNSICSLQIELVDLFQKFWKNRTDEKSFWLQRSVDHIKPSHQESEDSNSDQFHSGNINDGTNHRVPPVCGHGASPGGAPDK